MGLDLLTLEEAKAQAKLVPRAPVGSHITAALNDNQQNLTMLVIGDSTGVPQGGGTDNRWVYFLAQYLATAFPAYTVKHYLWNDTNTNYDAATTIQTGTGTGNAGGPWVLSVYNGSKSGATASYWAGKLLTVSPVVLAAPDLILISDGHNETGQGAGMRARMMPLLRAVKAMCVGSPVALVTQNPQNAAGSSSSTTEAANQLLRMNEIRKLAGLEGFGLIDVTPAFLADASYTSNLILADGIHPTPTGSALWATVVEQHFPLVRDRAGVRAPGPGIAPGRIWVPAQDFALTTGTPTLTSVQGVPCWSMAAAAVSSVGRAVDVPTHWETMNVLFYWCVGTVSTNTIRVRPNYGRVSGTLRLDSTGSGLVLPNPTVGTLTTITPPGAANKVSQASLFTGTDLLTGFTGRPILMQFERTGTDGSDTFATALFFLGMILERNT